jgi:protein involved in polysaccharide export with SLBB domain
MGPGQGRSSWQRRWLLGAVLGLLAGCSASRSQLEQALLADRTPAAHAGAAAARYLLHCPDVLEVTVDGREGWTGPRRVGADGRIDLGEAGRPRVDGLTVAEAARTVAEQVGVPPERVHVRVAEFHSQTLYLIGEVPGLQRAVPYRGPETVLDLLQRVGGITPGAAPGDIQVVRAHVADGKPPEVYHVDLAAIVLKKDQHTNVPLEPFDQVYVGENRRSSFACCLPPWLRPLFKAACGMSRPGAGGSPAGQRAPTARPPG